MDIDLNGDGAEVSNTKPKKAFSLSDAMMNQSQLNKVRKEQDIFKQILVDMQIHVKEHRHRIQTEMVTEEKLRITQELMEAQYEEQIKRSL